MAVPAAPSIRFCLSKGPNQIILLVWDPVLVDINGAPTPILSYNVYASPTGDPYNLVLASEVVFKRIDGGIETSWTGEGTAGVLGLNTFAVSAVNSTGESVQSVVCAVPDLDAPDTP
jgi:hypothetical protein